MTEFDALPRPPIGLHTDTSIRADLIVPGVGRNDTRRLSFAMFIRIYYQTSRAADGWAIAPINTNVVGCAGKRDAVPVAVWRPGTVWRTCAICCIEGRNGACAKYAALALLVSGGVVCGEG